MKRCEDRPEDPHLQARIEPRQFPTIGRQITTLSAPHSADDAFAHEASQIVTHLSRSVFLRFDSPERSHLLAQLTTAEAINAASKQTQRCHQGHHSWVAKFQPRRSLTILSFGR